MEEDEPELEAGLEAALELAPAVQAAIEQVRRAGPPAQGTGAGKARGRSVRAHGRLGAPPRRLRAFRGWARELRAGRAPSAPGPRWGLSVARRVPVGVSRALLAVLRPLSLVAAVLKHARACGSAEMRIMEMLWFGWW